MALGAAADATISSGNPDLYGWAVEDRALLQIGRSAHGGDNLRPGDIAYDNPDLLGWAVNDRDLLGVPIRDYAADPSMLGVGDSYGSILHEVGFDW